MVEECIPCIGGAIKEAIYGANPELDSILKKIKECDNPFDLNFCSVKGRLNRLRRKGEKREKRDPSAYNMFISQCMKQQKSGGGGREQVQDAMRSCAAQWKKKKGG